jgi:hypothetical protein
LPKGGIFPLGKRENRGDFGRIGPVTDGLLRNFDSMEGSEDEKKLL